MHSRTPHACEDCIGILRSVLASWATSYTRNSRALHICLENILTRWHIFDSLGHWQERTVVRALERRGGDGTTKQACCEWKHAFVAIFFREVVRTAKPLFGRTQDTPWRDEPRPVFETFFQFDSGLRSFKHAHCH